MTRIATRPNRGPWLVALATPLVLVFALPIVALVVYSEFQSSLDASVAAAAILVAAAGGILVAARLVRWRPGLETL